MLTFRDLTLTRGTKILLNHVNVSLHEKQKIGLVGQNGCGKSSLFSLILGRLAPDTGECMLNAHLRISHLSQTLPDSHTQAIDFVLEGDDAYHALKARISVAEQAENDEEVVACHELLSQTGGYGKPALAATILAGLGFKPDEIHMPVNSFSGGWRMRLSLARCLMKPADLLLLDEPTNHLDMEAIFWLEKWLKQSPASILLISHDREFLDAFVTHTLHIERQNLTLYSGSYSTFEKTRAQQLLVEQKAYEKQQTKINHMMVFVNKFRAKATKAKQAQSRLNAIAKMDVLAQANLDSPFSFEFQEGGRVGNPIIHCEQVSAGYDKDTIILKRMNLVLNPGDRIALLGPNGQGKSTLIKTLTGELDPISGRITRAQNLKIGYYAQHQLEQLDNDLSPIQTIQALTIDAREQTIRDYLGGFNFIGAMAESSIRHFSGGEKARLALAKLVWLKPNLLLLDEPTNHLDLNMRAAIEMALQTYEGALILISHDRHLLRTTVDSFYLVFQQKVDAFAGDLDDYYQWLQQREKEPVTETDTLSKVPDYREKRNLQNQLKRLEQKIETHQQQLKELDHRLADSALYESSQKQEMNTLLEKRANTQEKLMVFEEEWLIIAEQL